MLQILKTKYNILLIKMKLIPQNSLKQKKQCKPNTYFPIYETE